jgi:hypothetical protein
MKNQPLIRGVAPMIEILIVLGVLAAWIILNAWLLPRLGVPT